MARNAKVYIAARSQEKTEAAIKDLKDQTGKEAIWLKLDLSDLNAVKAAAEEFLRYGTNAIFEISVLISQIIAKKLNCTSSITMRLWPSSSTVTVH